MQGTYNFIPETNHVTRVYRVAAVLYLQFVLPVVLLRLGNMFCTFTLAHSVRSAVPHMALSCTS